MSLHYILAENTGCEGEGSRVNSDAQQESCWRDRGYGARTSLLPNRRNWYSMQTSAPPSLTVLTDPVPVGRDWPIETVKSLLRPIKRLMQPLPAYMKSPYRGHPAVTRSLVDGLRQTGIEFTLNPSTMRKCADTVIVLAGVAALDQAIRLKRAGKISFLLAGPNILEYPSDHNALIASPEVDVCVVPSDWVLDLYEADCPALKGRVAVWPAGVDTAIWSPDRPPEERPLILFYEKLRKGPIDPIEPYVEYVQSLGFETDIIRAGAYSVDEYRTALRRSALMVGFVVDESQGLAWAEAWSCDVTTLLWKSTYNPYQTKPYSCSSAPYLTEENGEFFEDLENFKLVFQAWESQRDRFSPREWTLAHMSDSICAELLLGIIRDRAE